MAPAIAARLEPTRAPPNSNSRLAPLRPPSCDPSDAAAVLKRDRALDGEPVQTSESFEGPSIPFRATTRPRQRSASVTCHLPHTRHVRARAVRGAPPREFPVLNGCGVLSFSSIGDYYRGCQVSPALRPHIPETGTYRTSPYSFARVAALPWTVLLGRARRLPLTALQDERRARPPADGSLPLSHGAFRLPSRRHLPPLFPHFVSLAELIRVPTCRSRRTERRW